LNGHGNGNGNVYGNVYGWDRGSMRVNIVTIFPGFFEGPLGLSIPARAAARGWWSTV
jgi:hypothetical protein